MLGNTHGVFKALYNGYKNSTGGGECEKGDRGLLWVKGDLCTWVESPEVFKNQEFRSGLIQAMNCPVARDLFFVAVETPDKVHVITYPRSRVFAEVEKEIASLAKPSPE